MQTQWLIHEHQDKLLLFFNGWGMDGRPFQSLASKTFDVFMLYDYQDLGLREDLRALGQAYREIHVLAWSMGVWVCAHIQNLLPEKIASTTAVNGTLQPIHPQYGINPFIFDATLNNLSQETLLAFYRNMFSGKPDCEQFFQNLPQRPLEEIIHELKQLRQFILSRPAPPTAGNFQAALIGKRDLIMPAAHQLRFWKNRNLGRIISFGHFPFYACANWEDLNGLA